MNLSKYTTKELISELSRRAEQVDQVLSALTSLAPTALPSDSRRGGEGRGLVLRSKSTNRPLRRILNGALVLQVLTEHKKPLTAVQIHRRLRKGTLAGVTGQVRRLAAEGKVKRVGETKPFFWTAA